MFSYCLCLKDVSLFDVKVKWCIISAMSFAQTLPLVFWLLSGVRWRHFRPSSRCCIYLYLNTIRSGTEINGNISAFFYTLICFKILFKTLWTCCYLIWRTGKKQEKKKLSVCSKTAYFSTKYFILWVHKCAMCVDTEKYTILCTICAQNGPKSNCGDFTHETN